MQRILATGRHLSRNEARRHQNDLDSAAGPVPGNAHEAKVSSFWQRIGMAIFCAAMVLAAAPVQAHTEGISGGFTSGLAHPMLGWDHVTAMVAVGLWGAFLGRPAIFVLPVVFPLIMAFGGALGIMGLPLPGVEIGIASSAVVLGALILLAATPPLWLAAVIVGAFAIFHGYAHGTELPAATSAFAYAAGFVIGTGLLHLVGIAFGLFVRWPVGQYAVRASGGVISLIGLIFLSRIV